MLSVGGRGWIAGVIYIHNLIRAISLLPESERRPLCLILGPRGRIDDHSELEADQPPIEYYAYRKGSSNWRKSAAVGLNLVLGRVPCSLEYLTKRLRPSVLFPAQISLGRNFPVPWIGWIPDFQHRRLPHYFSDGEMSRRDIVFRDIVQDADRVVVSSETAMEDFGEFYPESKGKVSVFPFTTVSAPSWFQGDPKNIAAEFDLAQKYLIFPSQFWIHKNQRVLFEAVRILKERGVRDLALVCTGQTLDPRHRGYFEKLSNWIRDHGLESNIRILGLIDRDKQIHLMRRAAAVIQPSLFEGWSALVEDARTLGKCLYISDIPVHREQNPPNAAFFDPESPEHLADLIERDWSLLEPGPDEEVEVECQVKNRERALDFARRFIDITALAVQGNRRGKSAVRL